MLLYNGRKGKGLKYLFYLFYPLHIWKLTLIIWISSQFVILSDRLNL